MIFNGTKKSPSQLRKGLYFTSPTVNIPTPSIELNIFPNPTTNGLIQIKSIANSQRVKIFNSLGQLMIDNQPINRTIDISTFPKGIYWIVEENNKWTRKVIKN